VIQAVKDEAGRKKEFTDRLEGIESELGRIRENGSLSPSSIRIQLQLAAIKLMTEIIRFFDAALQYFAHAFLRESPKFKTLGLL